MAMLTAHSAEALVHIDDYRKEEHADVKCRHCSSAVVEGILDSQGRHQRCLPEEGCDQRGEFRARPAALRPLTPDLRKTAPMTEWHRCRQDLVRGE